MTKAPDDRIRRALEHTISDDQFNSEAILHLAETLSDEVSIRNHHADSIESILLDTLAEPDPTQGDSEENTHAVQLTDRTFSYTQDAAKSLNAGQVEGRYHINGDLGTGATGHVFSVRDNNFKRDIAVKFLLPKYASNEKRMLQFLNEARITAKLAHPNILPIHDIDFTEGALIYFTMGIADGDSLADLLQQASSSKFFPPAIASFNNRIRIIQQICHAISYAHGQNIVHKDIKPSNIMVGKFGEVLVVDWGTASYGSEEQSKSGLVGTPAYMSPEQARRETADHLSDIYCIGATFFHLLTLQYPCFNEDMDVFWELKKKGAYQEPNAAILKQIPKQLYTIAIKAMAANREDRYQDACEIIEDLEAYQHGRSVSAYKENLAELVTRLYRYNKVTFSLAVAGLLLIALAGLWLYNEKTNDYGPWLEVPVTSFNHTNHSELSVRWELISPEPVVSYLKSESDTANTIPTDMDADFPLVYQSDSLQFITSSPIPYNLLYRFPLPGNLRVSWQQQMLDADQAIRFYIGGRDSNHAYTFHLKNTKDGCLIQLFKNGIFFDQLHVPHPLNKSAFNAISIEKTKKVLMLRLNERLVYTYMDPEMLIGIKHQQFGFILDQTSQGSVKDIHIRRQKIPNRQEPISIANHYYSMQLYGDALVLYKNIRKNYPNSNMSPEALYLKGLCLSKLGSYQESTLAFQQFIQLYTDHPFIEHATAQFIISLAQTQKWAQCQDGLIRYHTAISLYNQRHLLFQSLSAICAKNSDESPAALLQLKTSIQQILQP